MSTSLKLRRPLPLIAVAGAVLGVACMLLHFMGGAGMRHGWLQANTGMLLLACSVYVGIGAALVSVLGAIATRPGSGRRGFVLSIVGLVLGVFFAWQSWRVWQEEPRRPPTLAAPAPAP